MDKKYLILALFSVILLSIFINIVSSENVCCQKTTGGNVCQNVPASECETVASQSSCDQTSFCQLGTCVNLSTGECSSNTPKESCTSLGNSWYDDKVDNVAACKRGCCQAGDQAAFVSNAACKNLATDYGVDIKFREDITDEATCLSSVSSEKKSACVFAEVGSKRCSLETKESCQTKKGAFYENILCSAPDLSDCAPTDNTICHNSDVYFVDSCGNLANVYDKEMFPSTANGKLTSAMTDYWTNIQEPKCKSKPGEKSCGKCDYVGGSSCKKDGNNEGYYCKDLSCTYDINDDGDTNDEGETLAHGESICAESSGAYPHIKVNPVNMVYEDGIKEKIAEGYTEYNLPGSRYYKLTCWEGEMITEPCADYRNEICKEGTIGATKDNTKTKDFRIAQCRVNVWRTCFDYTDKETCDNDYLDCKWVPGYRFDGATVKEDVRDEEQGSCVPLYAPGFDFWKEDSSGKGICDLGSVSTVASYETHWTTLRGDLKNDLSLSTANCFDNCAVIPGYGGDTETDTLIKIFKGDKSINGISDISKRAGYYCSKTENQSERGSIKDSAVIDCKSAGSIDLSTPFSMFGEHKPLPIFLSNKDFMNSITKRAKSLGDCGYKNNFVGVSGMATPEIITRLFQKLKQDGTIRKDGSSEIIYINDSFNGADERSKEITGTESTTASDERRSRQSK